MEKSNYSNSLLQSTEVIEECLERYKLSEIFLSFNGGKDCTVLLHLTLDIVRNRFPNEDLKSLKVVYIQPENPFPELENFIQLMESHYSLNLQIVTGNMKAALNEILKDNNIKACLMGTRKTDPYCEDLEFFKITDSNWPKMMRVSPLLNWTYHEIWGYLRENQVPYCYLYEIGYTSIGSKNNTFPNPALQTKDSSGKHICYKPAYFLDDGALERNGRNIKTFNGTS